MRGNSTEVKSLQSLVHNLMDMATDIERKKDELNQHLMVKRAVVNDKDVLMMMEQFVEQMKKKEEKTGTTNVDLMGMDLHWTTEEQKVVSLKEVQRNWDMYSLICFVWGHFIRNLEAIDNDTYENELVEVRRLMSVFHHKMHTKDSRRICVVPTFLDRETRIHFQTHENITAVQKNPFTVLERSCLPLYVADCDDSFSSSITEGVTTDESF